jgi:hypothetical protein
MVLLSFLSPHYCTVFHVSRLVYCVILYSHAFLHI